MNILQTIQQKAQAALSGIGNAIDQNQQQPGVQLLSPRVQQTVSQIPQQVANVGGNFLQDQTQKFTTLPSAPNLGNIAPFIISKLFNNFLYNPTSKKLLPASPLHQVSDLAQNPEYNALLTGQKKFNQLSPETNKQVFNTFFSPVLGSIGSSKAPENLSEATGQPKILNFVDNYKRGDVSTLQKSLDEILGTGSFRMNNKWQSLLPARNSAKTALESYAQSGDEQAKLVLDEVIRLEDQIANAQLARTTKKVIPINVKTPKSIVPTMDVVSPPEVPPNFLRLRGGNAPDFIVNPAGDISKVRQLTQKTLDTKTPEIFNQTPPSPSKNGLLLLPGEKPLQISPPKITSEPTIQTTPQNFYQKTVLEPLRYAQRTLGGAFPSFKQKVFDPLEQAKGSLADWKTSVNTQIDNLGIKAGSKESKYVQMLGEGQIKLQQVIADLGQDGAKKVSEAVDVFRNIYNQTRDFANLQRAKAGLKEIPFKPDYFRHTGDAPGFLSTDLGSGERSSSIFKQSGNTNKFDAVKGFANYIEKVGQAAFIDPLVPGMKQAVGDLATSGANPQFTDYFSKWINQQILGIKPAPTNSELANTVLSVADKVAANVRKNAIVGNVSSAVSQGLNVPSAVADVGTQPSGIKSLIKGTLNFVKNWKILDTANFNKDRYYEQPGSFNGSLLQKITDVGIAPIKVADKVATRYIESLYYEHGLNLGVADPLNYAGEQAKLAVGGRGVGDYSILQNSKLGKTFVPFTIETQNAINKIGDLMGDKRYGALVALAFINFGINKAMEKVNGQAPLIDPIGAAIDSYNQLTGNDGKQASKIKAAGALIQEALKISPVAQNAIAIAWPIAQQITKDNQGNSVIPNSSDVFGNNDPTRFGSANMYIPKNVSDLAFRFNPLGFGNQAKKTIEGVLAGNRGYTTNQYGNVTSPASQDIMSRIQMASMGQWNNPATQSFFNQEGNKSLTKTQSDTYRSLPTDQRETFFNSAQDVNKIKSQSGGDLTSILNGSTGNSSVPPASATPAVVSALKSQFNSKLNSGVTPALDEIKYFVFDGKSASSNSISDRTKTFKTLSSVLDNPLYSQDQKQAIINASGASKEDISYYTQANNTDSAKLQELLPKLENMDSNTIVLELMRGRKTIGGKQLISSGMVDYLYENNLLDKNQRDAIKAVTYDEITGRFGYKKSFGDKAGLSYKQALALYKVPLPKFSALKSISNLLQTPSAGQTGSNNERLLSDILKGHG